MNITGHKQDDSVDCIFSPTKKHLVSEVPLAAGYIAASEALLLKSLLCISIKEFSASFPSIKHNLYLKCLELRI